MRAITRPAVFVFLLLSLLPLVLFGNNGPWIGGDPNPNLTRLAEFPPRLVPNAFRRVSTWFNDRIGMRYPLIQIGVHWNMQVWNHQLRNEVLFGRDGWLFYNDDDRHPAVRMTDVRGVLRLPPEEVATFEAQTSAARQAFAACGKTAFIVVAPNKQSIYPEFLREGLGSYPRSRLDDLQDRLSPGARSMMIDPRPELRAAKGRFPGPIYFKTDSHWNALGAFIVYQKIVATLARTGAIDRPEIASLDRFDIATERFAGGDISVRLLSMPWRFPDDRVTLLAKGERKFELTEGLGRQMVSNPDGRGRLLLLGDSFSWSLAALLARHFRETHVLTRPTTPLAFDGQLVAEIKPDVVLLEVVERHLPDLLTPPRDLARVCE